MNRLISWGNTYSRHKVAVVSSGIAMNRLLFMFLAGPALLPAAQAQTFGVSTGANFQRLSDITLDEVEVKFKSHTGWHVGIWAGFPLGPAASLRIGGRYMAAGKLFEGIQEEKPRFQDNFDVSLVELHALLTLGLPSQVVSPFVFAGPVFRVPAKTDKQISNDLKALSYAAEVGGGLKIGMGPISLYPEIAYTFGLTRFIENELVLQAIALQVGDPQKLNMVLLRLSVGL